MKVGLFVPCYIDQFYPSVAIATMQLLELQGVEVVYPEGQTCCGQPMANAGFEKYSGRCNSLFEKSFDELDYVVCPSGSCVLHLREHQERKGIFELVEFLTDILKVRTINARFPHKVVVHQGCHGLRGLQLASMSEIPSNHFSKPLHLLEMVKDIELVYPQRQDECCGFGGTFCVSEESVSVKMGKDRVADFAGTGAEIITSADMSCLMHIEGILKRQKADIAVRHIAEILTSR